MRAFFGPLAALAVASATPNEPVLSDVRPAQQEDLRFSVASETVGQKLLIKGSITSKVSAPVTVAYGACFDRNVRVRLYRTPERKGPPVWDNRRRPARAGDVEQLRERLRRGPPLVACPDILYLESIPPRGSISPTAFAGEVSGRALPESVPEGTYYATASVLLDGSRVESDEIPVGIIVVEHR